jgi:LacI family transcriptional regulator
VAHPSGMKRFNAGTIPSFDCRGNLGGRAACASLREREASKSHSPGKIGAVEGRPTILDVARRAGVSVGTASNVLNGRGNVSAPRRAKVEAAMTELGYLPSQVAQSLRRSESRVIGLCTPLVTSPYFAALLETFEHLAARQGYEVMQVLSQDDPELELRRVRALVGRHIDGLILIPTGDPGAALELLADRGTPTVLMDRVTGDERFDCVAIDDRKAMREAARHLIRLGHRRLLYIMREPRLPTTRQRIEGFHDAAASARPAVNAVHWQRDPDEAAFAGQVAAAMADGHAPTAIIASNSTIALSLLRILQSRGVRIPGDVSLLVFDEPVWAPIVTPPLAVVRHPTRQMACAAWQRLLLRLQAPKAPPQQITLEACLIPAASIGPPRGERRSVVARVGGN